MVRVNQPSCIKTRNSCIETRTSKKRIWFFSLKSETKKSLRTHLLNACVDSHSVKYSLCNEVSGVFDEESIFSKVSEKQEFQRQGSKLRYKANTQT